MDWSFFFDVLKLIVILPFVIFLIYISIKYGGKYMKNMNNGGIIKVHERIPLSQNSFISVVTIGDKPYVITNGDRGAEILLELDIETFNSYKSKRSIHEMNLVNYLKKYNLIKRNDANEKS